MTDDTTRAEDVAFIEALARLLREQDLSEIEVDREYGEDDTLSVRVARGGPPPLPAPAPAPAPAAAIAPPLEAPAPGASPAEHPGAVTSPMVGTAYLSPEPNAAAFVQVGAQVVEGQTILILEAMKTMNQIPSPRAGTVTRILVEDGTPVEFGAPLMIVE